MSAEDVLVLDAAHLISAERDDRDGDDGRLLGQLAHDGEGCADRVDLGVVDQLGRLGGPDEADHLAEALALVVGQDDREHDEGVDLGDGTDGLHCVLLGHTRIHGVYCVVPYTGIEPVQLPTRVGLTTHIRKARQQPPDSTPHARRPRSTTHWDLRDRARRRCTLPCPYRCRCRRTGCSPGSGCC